MCTEIEKKIILAMAKNGFKYKYAEEHEEDLRNKDDKNENM